MKIINKTNGNILATETKVANTYAQRAIGLLSCSKLDKGKALHIIPCNSIHSFFMRFNFDAIFIDKENKIKHIIKNMYPFRISRICFSAHSVIELPAGTLDETNTKTGDIIEFT